MTLECRHTRKIQAGEPSLVLVAGLLTHLRQICSVASAFTCEVVRNNTPILWRMQPLTSLVHRLWN